MSLVPSGSDARSKTWLYAGNSENLTVPCENFESEKSFSKFSLGENLFSAGNQQGRGKIMIKYIIESILVIEGQHTSSAEHSVLALDDPDFRHNVFKEWKESRQDRMSRMFPDVRMSFVPTRVRRVDQEFKATDIVIPN